MFARLVPFAFAAFIISALVVGLVNGFSQSYFLQPMPRWATGGMLVVLWLMAVGWYVRYGERQQGQAEQRRATEERYVPPPPSWLDRIWEPNDRRAAMGGLKFALFFFGLFGFFAVIGDFLTETRLFADPRYEGFWEDVEAYHFKPDPRPDLAAMRLKYDPDAVASYFEKPSLRAAYLPNENAAFLNVLTYAARDDDTTEGRALSWGLTLMIVYVPIAFGFRLAQEYLASWICIGRRARAARDDYFSELREGRFRSTLLVFGLIAALAFLRGAIKIHDLPSDSKLTLVDIVVCFVFVAYVGGLMMRLVSYAVELGLLVFGVNPHASLWDEAVALAVVAPVLLLVYNNSWWTVLSSAVAGLGSAALVKWLHARRRRATQPAAALAPAQ